jgi:hypothetical protein
MTTTYVQQMFNAGAPVVLTERTITLDDRISVREHPRVDFVKVDTDGHDIEVILGARNILAAGGVLGLRVEMQFHGSPHEYANTFSNIDRLLRERGFSLFDLDVYRYSRADLPAPFVYDIPAQTTTGQVSWGEALYLRDLGSPTYEAMWNYDVTRERVMKLAALFDLFDLPDCAAELLRNRAHFLDDPTRENLLDLLVSDEPGAYASLLATFERDFTEFYRSRMAEESEGPKVAASPAAAPSNSGGGIALTGSVEQQPSRPDVVRELEQRLTTLRKRNAVLRERLAQRNERLKRVSRRLAELTAKP